MKLAYRIGNAIDHHQLVHSSGIIKLGNKEFKSNYLIKAHSDGDVVLHAISNAILNAIGMDDIGTYFSDKDEKNKNLSSLKIIDFALRKLEEKKYKIENISIVLVSDYIFLKPHKEKILFSLKNILKNCDISIHGTRTEQNLNIISAYVTILITSSENINDEK